MHTEVFGSGFRNKNSGWPRSLVTLFSSDSYFCAFLFTVRPSQVYSDFFEMPLKWYTDQSDFSQSLTSQEVAEWPNQVSDTVENPHHSFVRALTVPIAGSLNVEPWQFFILYWIRPRGGHRKHEQLRKEKSATALCAVQNYWYLGTKPSNSSKDACPSTWFTEWEEWWC